MTTEEHRQRHIELHHALDELLIDYIRHHHSYNRKDSFLSTPIDALIEWSWAQTQQPTETRGGEKSEETTTSLNGGDCGDSGVFKPTGGV